jgi:hypothetical protein
MLTETRRNRGASQSKIDKFLLLNVVDLILVFLYYLSLVPQLSQNFMPGTGAPHFGH